MTSTCLLSFAGPVPTLHAVPRFLVAGVRNALVAALDAIRIAQGGRDEVRRVRAWKLFLLLPRLLLARSTQTGPEGRAALLRRLELFRKAVSIHCTPRLSRRSRSPGPAVAESKATRRALPRLVLASSLASFRERAKRSQPPPLPPTLPSSGRPRRSCCRHAESARCCVPPSAARQRACPARQSSCISSSSTKPRQSRLSPSPVNVAALLAFCAAPRAQHLLRNVPGRYAALRPRPRRGNLECCPRLAWRSGP